MGLEILPPEQPVWVSRCCPDECVKERDELRRRCESYKSAYDAILADLKIMEKKLSDLEAERDQLKADNERLAESCRACMNELIDGPTTCKEEIIRIAKAALREVYGGKD